VKTFVRSVAELAKIASHPSFSDEELATEGNTLFVCFVAERPTNDAKKKLLSLASPIDGFHINEREVYWLYRRSSGESKFYGPPLEKSLGMQTTVRNVNTIQRLVKKYGGG